MSDTDEFPADLLDLQRRWFDVEAAWAADPTAGNRAEFGAISAELHSHPYWAGAENRHKASAKLKQAARNSAG
ncbi:hypothetical protein ACIQF6_34200 [Kitasatospora sp. NPDC092948]|uniref:hypothetical protein n=1 Tax=Kitasatospora sp. NPDC092948 TaxID=3364088 RepID=UPI003808C6E9